MSHNVQCCPNIPSSGWGSWVMVTEMSSFTVDPSLKPGGFTDDQMQILFLLRVIFGSLSLFGSLFIVVCYLWRPRLRKDGLRLVLWLSISDFGVSIGAALGGVTFSNKDLCIAQSYFLSFFELASVLWTACICFVLHKTVSKQRELRQRYGSCWDSVAGLEQTIGDRKYLAHTNEYAMHGGVWGISLILTILPQFFNAYGPAGFWCWITDEYPWLRFIQYYIPLWIVFIYDTVVCFKVIAEVRHVYEDKDSQYSSIDSRLSSLSNANILPRQSNPQRIIRNLMFYPLSLLVCGAFSTAFRIQNSVDPDDFSDFWLAAIALICLTGQGFINAIVYGFTSLLREELLSSFPCLTNNHHQTDNASPLLSQNTDATSPLYIPPSNVV